MCLQTIFWHDTCVYKVAPALDLISHRDRKTAIFPIELIARSPSMKILFNHMKTYVFRGLVANNRPGGKILGRTE